MRAWRDRNSAPQRITSLMVVFDPTGVLWCFCFTVFSLLVSLSRVRFTPSECHSSEKMIVKFFLFLMNAIAQFQSAVVVANLTGITWVRPQTTHVPCGRGWFMSVWYNEVTEET